MSPHVPSGTIPCCSCNMKLSFHNPWQMRDSGIAATLDEPDRAELPLGPDARQPVPITLKVPTRT